MLLLRCLTSEHVTQIYHLTGQLQLNNHISMKLYLITTVKMLPDDKYPWCKGDVENKETGEFVKLTLWQEKAELADGLSMFSN